MKRDMDLIRLILLEKEGAEEVKLSGFTQDEINYHIALLIDKGFLEGYTHYPVVGKREIPDRVSVKRITWDGHEFLEKARNDTTWNKAKKFVAEKGQSLSLKALLIALDSVIKQHMQ